MTLNTIEIQPYGGIRNLTSMVKNALKDKELSGLSAEQIKEKLRPIALAYVLAKWKHAGQFRAGGKKYFQNHIKEVAKISLIELPNPSIKRVLVGLLHDIVEDTDITLETITNIFGPEIAHEVDLLTKKDYTHYMTLEEKEQWLNFSEETRELMLKNPEQKKKMADNRSKKYFIDLMESGIDDVVWDKIADRLHNLRSMIGTMKDSHIENQIEETEQYFLPLLEQKSQFAIGVNLLKEELTTLKRHLLIQSGREEIATAIQ